MVRFFPSLFLNFAVISLQNHIEICRLAAFTLALSKAAVVYVFSEVIRLQPRLIDVIWSLLRASRGAAGTAEKTGPVCRLVKAAPPPLPLYSREGKRGKGKERTPVLLFRLPFFDRTCQLLPGLSLQLWLSSRKALWNFYSRSQLEEIGRTQTSHFTNAQINTSLLHFEMGLKAHHLAWPHLQVSPTFRDSLEARSINPAT